jgi:hypothetical protein
MGDERGRGAMAEHGMRRQALKHAQRTHARSRSKRRTKVRRLRLLEWSGDAQWHAGFSVRGVKFDR